MDIYLDANATTPVLPQARQAALAAMAEDFGNPSSVHSTGLKARALMDEVRARARRVLGAERGQVLFLSGATEGIQTAVLSALSALRSRAERPPLLLYGATEHKAVPEALKHWNALLGLNLEVRAIPVDAHGLHDLDWLRRHAPHAGLVCTMAANNETGVVSDLDGIAAALSGSPAYWMVDGVQALGKMALQLNRRPIDYAPFSGHKLYAPKGIGLLYVREGAPFTPLLAGGGQEGALRAGTENMSGIAALGAVLAALEDGRTFQPHEVLVKFRDQLAAALREAFPGLSFNAPLRACLPTTLNFAVPGLSSKLLLDLFDAAEMHISGGSACSAAKAQPSDVLLAMGLAPERAASSVRLSFGPVVDAAFIDEACARIRVCGDSLRQSCLDPAAPGAGVPADGVTRYVVDGACCYVLADAASRSAVVIDPLPELTERLSQWLRCQGYTLVAALDTHSHGDHTSAAVALRAAVGTSEAGLDALGWPVGTELLHIGNQRLSRLATPGHTADAQAYLLHDARGLRLAWVGDTVLPGALGRSDFAQSAPLAFVDSLRALERAVGRHTLLLPAHDYDDHHATTLATESRVQPLLAAALEGETSAEAFAAAKADLERDLGVTAYQTVACGARAGAVCDGAAPEVSPAQLLEWLRQHPGLRLVDVREAYEQRLGGTPWPARDPRGQGGPHDQAVPLSRLSEGLRAWLDAPGTEPVVFFCRSGNRSAQAARALRRLGHAQAFSLQGGLALWPRSARAAADAALAI